MSEYTFDYKNPTELCEIMGRYNSDKGHIDITNCWHNYTTFYSSIFEPIRQKKLRVFELGLGTNNPDVKSNMCEHTNGGTPGASLYGWREYFPNSSIYGADIDKRILFDSDRIKTFYCDQTNPSSIKELWDNDDLQEEFDIIIEDGLHEYHANVCFFENSIHRLKKDGYYIIEDIAFRDTDKMLEKLNEWRNKYSDLSFTFICIPSSVNNQDNSLVVIKKIK